MDIEQVLPHVLHCIDTRRLGRRKVSMLELVYIQQGGKRNFVPLGDQELMRLTGRSRHQISYDRRALAELVKLGMLRKVQGRGSVPNGYSLREPRLWDSQRIRWLGPRERIISFFWALHPRDLLDLSRDDAGQTIFFRATGNLLAEVSPRETAGHAVAHRAATKSRRAANSALPVGIGVSHRAANSVEPPSASPCLCSSKDELSSSSLEEEEELERLARRVATAIARTNGRQRLWGMPLDQVRATLRQFPDRVEELHALVPLVAGIHNPNEATATFAFLAEEAAEAGWPSSRPAAVADPMIRALENQIRAWASAGEDTAHLEAELEQLRRGQQHPESAHAG